MFDDFVLGPQCEEFYDEAKYWEPAIAEEPDDLKEDFLRYNQRQRTEF